MCLLPMVSYITSRPITLPVSWNGYLQIFSEFNQKQTCFESLTAMVYIFVIYIFLSNDSLTYAFYICVKENAIKKSSCPKTIW